jgi:heme exporter protein CcmD
MGGYAYYVWPAYLLVAGIITGNLLQAYFCKRQVLKQLKKYYAA